MRRTLSLLAFLWLLTAELVAGGTHTAGGTGDDLVHAVGIDPVSGNTYVVGTTDSPQLDWGDGHAFISAGGSWQLFVLKTSPNGDIIWGKSFSTTTTIGFGSIVVDSQGK